jgi:hypothetical protein
MQLPHFHVHVHVEDVVKIKIKLSLIARVHFVDLHYIITMRGTKQLNLLLPDKQNRYTSMRT